MLEKKVIGEKIEHLKKCIEECDYYIKDQFDYIAESTKDNEHGYGNENWQKYNRIENTLKKIDNLDEQKKRYRFTIEVLEELLKS